MRAASIFVTAATCFGFSSALVYTTEDVLAKFDDLTVSPSSRGVNRISTYKGLEWTGFYVAAPHNPESDDFTGVNLRSAPNYAAGKNEENIFQITSSYIGSNVVFVDFQSLAWGCTKPGAELDQELAGWCSLDVYGFEPGSKMPTAHATSFFWPKEGVTKMDMVDLKFPDTFRGVSHIIIKLDTPDTILYFDDVKFTKFQVTAIGNGVGELIHDVAALQGKDNFQFPLVRSVNNKPLDEPQSPSDASIPAPKVALPFGNANGQT